MGNEKLFWRYIISDRQTGLELRGIYYSMQKIKHNLEASKEKMDELIEQSADSDRVLEAEK